MSDRREKVPWIAVGLISGVALAYEVLLTRLFAFVHWHHLVATVISLALLGYGASGTLLSLAGRRVGRWFDAAFLGNAVGFAVAMPVCFLLAQSIPLDPQALAWEPGQLARLAAVYLLLALPFFAAANCIGLTLWHYAARIPGIYSVDLLGAGAGALVIVLLLQWLHPATALSALAGAALVGFLAAAFELRRGRAVAVALSLLLAAGLVWRGELPLRPAPYKDLPRASAVAGAAVERDLSGPMGVVTVLRNDAVPLREAPGMSLLAAELPPEQRAVFVDGEAAGAFDRSTPGQLPGYLRDLVSALPYAVLERPRVLVVGAGSGRGVLQALLHGARQVVAVEPDPQRVDLVCGAYAGFTAACADPRVHWHRDETRAYLAGSESEFDLALLSAGGDLAGTGALSESYDLTVEAFTQYLERLTPAGVLAVDGPTRLPPRLVLRLAATVREALRRLGVDDAAEHLAVIRGWQRFVILATREPLGAERAAAVRSFSRRLAFDLVWLPGLGVDELNRYQRLDAAYFHEGVAALLGDAADAAVGGYGYDVAPATDDRPYAHRFTRWADLLDWPDAPQSVGGSRLDTGLVVGAATLVQAVIAGAVFILLPLAWVRRDRERPAVGGWRWRTPVYFGLIGLAFLFVEIAWIQRLQLFLGHPVYATAVVLAAFLVFAGLGSLSCQGVSRAAARGRLWAAVLGIAAIGLSLVLGLSALLDAAWHLPYGVRVLLSIGLIAPLAFAMGMPFPLALRTLGEEAPGLVPWAWAVNGCASVVSAVAAPLLALAAGFSGLLLVGLTCYLLLPGVFPRRLALA
jgi:hypothetical protein